MASGLGSSLTIPRAGDCFCCLRDNFHPPLGYSATFFATCCSCKENIRCQGSEPGSPYWDGLPFPTPPSRLFVFDLLPPSVLACLLTRSPCWPAWCLHFVPFKFLFFSLVTRPRGLVTAPPSLSSPHGLAKPPKQAFTPSVSEHASRRPPLFSVGFMKLQTKIAYCTNTPSDVVCFPVVYMQDLPPDFVLFDPSQ